MPILIHFDLKCTVSQYDFIWENLRQLGLDRGEGCLSHIGALKPDGNMIVTGSVVCTMPRKWPSSWRVVLWNDGGPPTNASGATSTSDG
ncbi:MAG: hypothetical protein ABL962_19590, partial [Fimbriimonadaceae bacterium]